MADDIDLAVRRRRCPASMQHATARLPVRANARANSASIQQRQPMWHKGSDCGSPTSTLPQPSSVSEVSGQRSISVGGHRQTTSSPTFRRPPSNVALRWGQNILILCTNAARRADGAGCGRRNGRRRRESARPVITAACLQLEAGSTADVGRDGQPPRRSKRSERCM
eukprot:scaffold11316_cov112-Isochrysis_galbana.AAC.3